METVAAGRSRRHDFGMQNNLGVLLLEQGKLDEAIACYRRALMVQPDFGPARTNLGLAQQWKRERKRKRY